ncbi:MAG: S-layer homology domain-containing protein [Oscillibacter sp.]|nr:S-layer homology domain-containing protein [Oscillibacter sp.]
MRRQRLYNWIVLCLLCVCVCEWAAPKASAASSSGIDVSSPSDVPQDSSYYEAVMDGLQRKFFELVNNQFNPETKVTRSEISLILWRAAGCPKPTGKCPLKDKGLDPGSDEGMAAWWIMTKEILSKIPGRPEYFEGSRELTRDEAVRCISQFLIIYDKEFSSKVSTVADPKGLKFADVASEDRYSRDIALCLKLGIIDETEKNAQGRTVFRPAAVILRRELAVMIFRYETLRDKTLTDKVA